ncbi:DUF3108 domain-containing protein [Shewanella sp. TC10]|uniref:DUF3108 domain-containing protein n=1 Tax=Shewanella sp. TC10 TaxID=1419739 RepID=UPI001E59B3D7|nr:DUF3108 domain-containing protein [Shewanella sp. TC10]
MKLFFLLFTGMLAFSNFTQASEANAYEVKVSEAKVSEAKALETKVTKTNQDFLKPLIPHNAEYKVFYGSIELGKARYQLPVSNNGYYNYRFDSDVSLLMLSDVRNIKSEFQLVDGKLKPIRYLSERSGTGSDYSEQTAFAASQGVIHTIYKDEREKLDYEENIFDPLMVQLQFRMDMYTNPETLEYEMVKEKEFDDYKFRIIGKEQMILDSGTYQTIKIEVVRSSKKRQTFFWMAPELNYLPVRLSHFSKGSKQLDIQIDNYQIFNSEDNAAAIPKTATQTN